MKGRLGVSGTARFQIVDPRWWWRTMGQAMLATRIDEAEREVERAQKQYRFALVNLDTLYQLRKEGRKRYGTRKKSVSARARGEHDERHRQRQAEANRPAG